MELHPFLYTKFNTNLKPNLKRGKQAYTAPPPSEKANKLTTPPQNKLKKEGYLRGVISLGEGNGNSFRLYSKIDLVANVSLSRLQ